METRTAFHQHLREVEEDVLKMGNMVAKAIDRAIQHCKTGFDSGAPNHCR
jgi:hypothetical protein